MLGSEIDLFIEVLVNPKVGVSNTGLNKFETRIMIPSLFH